MACMHCNETNDSFLAADPARHVVSCSRCKKDMESTMYTPKQLVDACLYIKQASKSGSNRFKKHTESILVSQLANLKNSENEAKLI